MPTEDEKLRIWTYMKKELKSKNLTWNILKYAVGCLVIMMTARVLYKFYEGISNYLELIIAILITIFFWYILKLSIDFLATSKKLAIHIEKGNFQVLECIPCASVYVYDSGILHINVETKFGVRCAGAFYVDGETALQVGCIDNTQLPMLLMYQEDTDESYLFSEIMLGYKEKGYYSDKKKLNKKS